MHTSQRARAPRLLLSAFCLLLSACSTSASPATPTAPYSAPFIIVTRDPNAAIPTPLEAATAT